MHRVPIVTFFAVLVAVLSTAAPAAAQTAVSNVGVSIGSPSAAAGARTVYVVTFVTSATGGLSQAANSRITLTFPSGTGFVGYFADQVFDVTTGRDVGSCSDSGLVVTCSLFSGESIAAGHSVRITLNGITNPSPAGPYTLDVSTTSDTQTVTSPAYSVVGGNALSGLSVAIGSPSAAAGARTVYVVNFVTSATGGLSQAANSRITLTFPSGTGFVGYFADEVFDVTTGRDVGSCSDSGLVVTCSLFSGAVIAAGDSVRITLNGITNPSTAGPYSLDVSTTSDLPAVTSPAYSVVGGNPLGGVSVVHGSAAMGATSQHVVNFVTSATGGLSQAANSRITLTFPSGTGFGGYVSDQVFDVATGRDVGSCSDSGLVVTCSLFSGESIAAGDSVRITLTSITNPATPGPYTLTLSTTSDTQTVTSPAYTVGGADTVPPQTTIDSGPSGTTGDATPAFTFSSNEAGSTFECRIVGLNAFGGCTSPQEVTPALSDGTYTFEVRARDAAGNLDGSPASRTFTVDTVPPATPAIESGPAAETTSATPTFTFVSTEPGVIFECNVDSAPFTPCSSPYTTEPLAPGPHTFAVRSRDGAGNAAAPATRSFTVAVPPVATPIPTPIPTPIAGAPDRDLDTVPDVGDNCANTPNADQADKDADGIGDLCDLSDASVPPVVAKTVIGRVVSGEVRVRYPPGFRPPGLARAAQSAGFVPLKGAAVLPVGSIVDTVRGRLAMTSAAGLGAGGRTLTQTADFYDGIFQIKQRMARQPVTDLALQSSGFARTCGRRTAAARAAQRKPSKKVVSRLWGSGKGRFRTRGRYSSATVRGTIWLTEDRCDGTLTRVTKGRLSVRDLVAKKTVTVRAGQTYLARAQAATIKSRRKPSR